MDIFLACLKFAAILSGGIWGGIGLRVDFKDHNGSITKWGRRALLGTIFSTLVAITAQGIETYKQRMAEEAERQHVSAELARMQTLLFAISRGVYPLREISADVTAEIDISGTEYFERIKKERRRLERSARAAGEREITRVDIAPSLYPDKGKDPVGWRLLIDFGVEFAFYKKPTQHLGTRPPNPDLLFRAHAPGKDMRLRLSLSDPVVTVEAWNLPVEPKQNWGSSGSIASVPDLGGAQVVVDFIYNEGTTDQDVRVDGALGRSSLNYLGLRIGEFWIPMPNQASQNSNGRVYAYQFPQEVKPGLALR